MCSEEVVGNAERKTPRCRRAARVALLLQEENANNKIKIKESVRTGQTEGVGVPTLLSALGRGCRIMACAP